MKELLEANQVTPPPTKKKAPVDLDAQAERERQLAAMVCSLENKEVGRRMAGWVGEGVGGCFSWPPWYTPWRTRGWAEGVQLWAPGCLLPCGVDSRRKGAEMGGACAAALPGVWPEPIRLVLAPAGLPHVLRVNAPQGGPNDVGARHDTATAAPPRATRSSSPALPAAAAQPLGSVGQAAAGPT